MVRWAVMNPKNELLMKANLLGPLCNNDERLAHGFWERPQVGQIGLGFDLKTGLLRLVIFLGKSANHIAIVSNRDGHI